jgi:uncharacterized membrane protein AbrB (regulator of aidB expression)
MPGNRSEVNKVKVMSKQPTAKLYESGEQAQQSQEISRPALKVAWSLAGFFVLSAALVMLVKVVEAFALPQFVLYIGLFLFGVVVSTFVSNLPRGETKQLDIDVRRSSRGPKDNLG